MLAVASAHSAVGSQVELCLIVAFCETKVHPFMSGPSGSCYSRCEGV